MDPRVAALIDALAHDRTSGAAELARRAAQALALVPPADLPEAAAAVARAQPAMAAVYNAVQAALRGALPAFLENLGRVPDVSSLLRGRVVLTHSHSSAVVSAIRNAGVAAAVCTESLPGGEGRTAAAALGARLIPDAALYREMAGVDVVVVGADAVTPELVVNKLGTALVALAARERGVPAYVLAGSEKLVPAAWQPVLGELFEATPRSWFTAVLTPIST